MKLKALLLAVACTFAQAQEVQETSNLVNMMNWSGVSYPDPSIFTLCCSGGPGPAMNINSNTLRFSYGLSTATQVIGINQVLSGQGIQVNGFNYSWSIDNSGMYSGIINSTVGFKNAAGQTVESYYFSYGTNTEMTRYTGTKTFASPYDISTLSSASVSFTGKDSRFWAGYYGPRVQDVSLTLNYTAGTAPPPPPPTPTPLPTVPTTTTTVVTPTETLITETVSTLPTTTTVAEPTTTVTTLVSTPVAAATAAAANTPTAAPVRTGGPANTAAVSMVLRNNAAQQAALQSSNLTASIQQSQQSSADTGGGGTTNSDSISLGMSSFNTAARQTQDAMTQDASSPTSTRNLLNMMSTKPMDTEQQEREDRAARNIARDSSSATAVGAELGTGASLTAMAQVPQGYAAYSVQLITQVPFYAPREVYRNQRVVDNERLRRGLSGRSDRLHHDMVDSQYNRGN